MTTREVTTLLLVCHGESNASAVADMVHGHAPAAIYTSPAHHAGEIAGAIAARCGLVGRVDALLAEPDTALTDAAPDAVQARMVAAAELIVRAAPGQTVAIVADHLALYALVCHSLAAPLPVSWSESRPFSIGAASMSVVEVGSDGLWTLLRLNESCHLPPEQRPTG